MNEEERRKYDCPKDKENLEKAQKTGRSFMYFSQYARKDIFATIAIVGIYISIILAGTSYIENQAFDKLQYQKTLLVIQVDAYIKHDYKNMNCVEKNVFLEKYITDKSIYYHQEMKDWLQENFNDNCNLTSNQK